MAVSQASNLRAGLRLLALLLCSVVTSCVFAEDRASAQAISVEELLSDVESSDPPKRLFSTDDKALRASLVTSKKDIIEDIPATAPIEFRVWMNALLSAFERNDLATSSHTLARSHDLPESAVLQLVRSFALVRAHKFAFFGDEAEDTRNRTRLIRDIHKGLDEAPAIHFSCNLQPLQSI